MEKDIQDSSSTRRPYYPELCTLEVILYILIYCSTVFGTISTLLFSSQENERRYYNYRYLEKGWHDWIGSYKDTSDFEWAFWRKYFLPVVVVGFTGHFITARFADVFCAEHRFKVYLLYSVLFTVYVFGIYGLFFMLLHFSMQYSAAVLSKSISVCWISGCVLAYSLLNETCVLYVKRFFIGDEDRAYFLLYSVAMCNLRLIAFSIEYVWVLKSDSEKINASARHPNGEIKDCCPCNNQTSTLVTNCQFSSNLFERSENSRKCPRSDYLSFFNLLMYQMYYPVFYGGPIINYNEFVNQMRRPPVVWSHSTTKIFVLGTIRYIFWHIITDLLLHFFYVSAVSSDYTLLRNLPLFHLLGVAFAAVIFFGLKYFCMYGLPAHFATSDNLNIPAGPHCVFAKHRMTDMWKYFDKGLHKWLVRYIYIPSGGSQVGLLRMTVNSILPFAFVCCWHGANSSQIRWATWSWLGVYLEAHALAFYKSDFIQALEHKYLTPAWSRRLRGLLSAPLLFLLLTSNLYFLCGVKVGDVFWRRLWCENWVTTMLMMAVFYTGCQTSMELERSVFHGERRKNLIVGGLILLSLLIGGCLAAVLRQ